MRCLRIFGAYSFKLMKRHTTFMTIAIFCAIVTGIFQLYSLKYYKHPKTRKTPDDYEYKPGDFLKNKQPNVNSSYCEFNYGLPDKFKWSSVNEHPPPETGLKSLYRVIYNAIKSTAYAKVNKYNSVTYVTHATPEYIYHIVEIARYWEGPISLAIFVPDYDLDISMQILKQLCGCYEGMSKVSVHLFYPKKIRPRIATRTVTEPTVSTIALNSSNEDFSRIKLENYRNLNKTNRAEYIQNSIKKKLKKMMVKVLQRTSVPLLTFRDCSGTESTTIETYRNQHKMFYPVNVGRNAARNATITNYFLVSDIELIPSEGLDSKFVKMVRNLMGEKKRNQGYVFTKTVFVVPLFEVMKGEEIPRDKETLVEMVNSNRAQYFHKSTCAHCQRFPGIQTWLSKPATKELTPLLIGRRQYPYHRWEPLYFGTHKDPWYSEVLSWEGLQDKMTQMLEFCLQGYHMVVLDGGFMCHAFSSRKFRDQRAEKINRQNYIGIIKRLKSAYPEKPECKINHGYS